MNQKEIVIYTRKADEEMESKACLAEIVLETEDQVIFQTQEYLSVELGLNYYVKKHNPEALQEQELKHSLYRIEFSASNKMKAPYIYTAVIEEKWKDVD